MRQESLYYLAAAVLSIAAILTPAKSQARSHNLNLNFEGSADRCSDLKIRSRGEIAQTAESFTLQKSEAPVLELNAVERGHIRVRGWDRPEYSVEACKIAAAEDRAGAEQLLRSVSVTRSAGRFSSSGPGGSDAGEWLVYFIVHAPKDAKLDLESRNGPVEIVEVSGNVKVRATNGPVAVRDCSGEMEVHTANGPIALSGGSGEVHLNARNGPIAVRLAGEIWNGSQLEARTINGPLSVSMPNGFRSGVRVETSGHAPISCRLDACRSAWENTGEQRVLQMNGSGDTVRLSTENGPVSVGPAGKSARFM